MNKVELFANERATDYDSFVKKWIPNYQYFIDMLPDLIKDITTKNILIVGCGTGAEIKSFTQSKANWQITGVDPSPEMIDQAKQQLSSLENVTLIEGVVSDLDSRQKFTAATLLLVLHFMQDNGEKLALLKDIASRLETNSPFILLDITGSNQQIQDNLQILRLLLPNDIEPVEIDKRLHRIANELHAISQERFSELLVEAGFKKPIRFFQNSIYTGWLTKKT